MAGAVVGGLIAGWVLGETLPDPAAPSAPPPPPQPDQAEVERQAQASRQRQRQRGQGELGRSDTILTGPLGIPSPPPERTERQGAPQRTALLGR